MHHVRSCLAFCSWYKTMNRRAARQLIVLHCELNMDNEGKNLSRGSRFDAKTRRRVKILLLEGFIFLGVG